MSQTKTPHTPEDPKQLPGASHAATGDDLIVVPRGQSKFQFYTILGLFIFILIIFTVGPFFQSYVGGMFRGGGPETYFRWVHPESGATTEFGYLQFMERKRALDRLHELGLYAPAGLRDGDPDADVSDEDTAMWLILDRLAQEQGVAITVDDMRQRIEASYQSPDAVELFRNGVRRNGFSVAAVEEDLKSWMRAELYTAFLKSGLAIADPADVERLWSENEQNTLFAFDYATLPAEGFTEAARAENPADEALLEWLHSKSEQVQKGFRTDDRIVVEVAWIPLEEGAFEPSPLLEKYPAPEGWDELAQARRYHSSYSNVRFRAPPPEETPDEAPTEDGTKVDEGEAKEDEAPTEGGESGAASETTDAAENPEAAQEQPVTDPPPASGEQPATETPATDQEQPAAGEGEGEAAQTPEPKLYLTFEESEARARQEAGWKRAMDQWLADVQKRTDGGETVDFRAEAEAFGLRYEHSGEALARETLEKSPGWGGPLVVGSLFFAQPGRYVRTTQVQEGSMVVGRTLEKVDGVERPLDEIRDRLLEDWVKERAVKLAVEKLEAVRDALGTRPPEGSEEVFLPTVDRDTFTKAVEAAGYQVVQRPYLRRFELPDDNYDEATPGDHHIRVTSAYLELEEGQVPAAEPNAEGTHAILVRAAGKKTAPLEEMKPNELQNLRRQAIHESTQAFEKRYLRADSDHARALYKIFLAPRDAPPQEQG